MLIDENTGEIKEITARTKKKNIKFDFSRTIVNRVINDGKAIAMSDTSREDGINLSDSIGKMRIRSIMCVPLISKRATRGVIYVHSVGRPNAFRKDDLFLLTGLSSPAALAIENALLYLESRRAQEALEALNNELEQRIKGRTAELSDSNALLKKEVTEHRETEEALSKSEESYRFLVENANDIIYKADSTGHFTFFNPIAVKATKYSEQELTGKHFTKLMRQDYRKKAERFYVLQIVKKIPSTYYEFPMITKDGEEVWLGQHVQLIIESDQILGVHAIARDITGRKRAEKALRESRKKLRFLSSHLLTVQEKEQRRISLELHDDLGQTLAVLKLQLQSIHDKMRQNNGTIKKDLAASLNAVDQIIESVRRLSRDLSPSILEDLGLSAAIRWLVREFKERFKINFTSSIPEIDNLFPREGQTLIYRIFQEAFTNIGKHAQANNVSVKINKGEKRVFFLVKDDGIGFDVEEQDALDHTEKGMGLSAMDERVRMLGGQLEVSSQRNQGTTISFIIPI